MGQATAGQHYARERRPAQENDYRERETLMGGGEDSMDKLLYHNLVEMIPFVPLVDSLMQDQQPTRSFPRHASLVYTPTPPREAWPFQKAVDHPTKGKQGRGQLLSSKRGELKSSPLWDNAENMLHDDQNLYGEEIPMLPYPSDHRANRAAASSVETIQLRRKVQQLEQKLSEKECQLQAAEKTAQQFRVQLNATVERLQSQIQQKDQAIQNVQNQLFERQLEVVSLQSLVKKSEVNMQASSMKAASLEEELEGLRGQVGALLFLVQSQMSGLQEEPTVETPPPAAEEPPAFEEPLPIEEPAVVKEPVCSTPCDLPSMVDMHEVSSSQEHEMSSSQGHEMSSLEEDRIEETRRKYLTALITARENPNDEMLSIVAELRKELYALVMCPVMTIDTMDDGRCWQPLGLSIC